MRDLSQHVGLVPKAAQCTAAKRCLFDHLVGARERRHAWPSLACAQRGAAGDCYSFTLMPVSLINFAHCGISDLILAAKSDGVLATISMPRFCRCLRASFCSRTRAVSL